MSHARLDGFRVLAGFLDRKQQEYLLEAVRGCVRRAPLFQPVMPGNGKPFSVRMTNMGRLGWVSDHAGYRYQEHHPVTGENWPAIPDVLLNIWRELARCEVLPDACLVNFYGQKAKMGLHVDGDERDVSLPVVSVSLGDSAIFRIGGCARRDATRSLKLASGDVVVLGGKARRCYHGIDRILPGSSSLLREPGRLNLTLRCAG